MDWNYNGHNYTLKSNDGNFYVSFMPGKDVLGGIKAFAADGDEGETALVVDGEGNLGTNFYILNGDFRKEYETALPKGLEECRSVFLDNQNKKSSWSN